MNKKPRLPDQLRDQIRLKHYSIHLEEGQLIFHADWPLLAGSSLSEEAAAAPKQILGNGFR